ncbi:MAG: zf-TFIIB domain-containing protein [Polyangia bacterium]
MVDDRRTCPVCREALEEIPLGDHLVDRCPVCQGLFFDAGELESLVRLARLLSEVRLDEPEIDAVPAEVVGSNDEKRQRGNRGDRLAARGRVDRVPGILLRGRDPGRGQCTSTGSRG